MEWHVKVGDLVREDTILAAVMTDKATVEIPSPVSGEVLWLGAEVGDSVAVGSPLIRLKVEGEGSFAVAPSASAPAQAERRSRERIAANRAVRNVARPKATPAGPGNAVRRRRGPRAKSRWRLRRFACAPGRRASICVRFPGSGPAGRISHQDLEAFIARGPQAARPTGLQQNNAVEDVKLVGLRRRIAEKMALANARIPHITYVEEVDVTALEELGSALNKQKRSDQPKLTLLPFLMRAMVKAIAEQPNFNALFDDEAGIVHQHGGVHIGVAAQTPAGLIVPVVRHAEARDLWDCAAEVDRLAEAAKTGAATREELSGSTITITSLGAMGGVATTPIINSSRSRDRRRQQDHGAAGLGRIGLHSAQDDEPVLELRSSRDRRLGRGVFVQRIKTLLETPAMIFVEG